MPLETTFYSEMGFKSQVDPAVSSPRRQEGRTTTSNPPRPMPRSSSLQTYNAALIPQKLADLFSSNHESFPCLPVHHALKCSHHSTEAVELCRRKLKRCVGTWVLVHGQYLPDLEKINHRAHAALFALKPASRTGDRHLCGRSSSGLR